MRKRTNNFQSWEMERSRFSEKSTLAGELITAFSSYWEYVYLTFSDRQRLQTFSVARGITDLARGPFFHRPIYAESKLSHAWFIPTHSAGPPLVVMVLHGVYPRFIPTQRVPTAISPPHSRARKTPEKYNSTISGAYALESLRAIIHARRMLLPWQFPPTWAHIQIDTRARALSSSQYWPTLWMYMHVCADMIPCPRARECIGKYDITHGKVPGHLCRVNY